MRAADRRSPVLHVEVEDGYLINGGRTIITPLTTFAKSKRRIILEEGGSGSLDMNSFDSFQALSIEIRDDGL